MDQITRIADEQGNIHVGLPFNQELFDQMSSTEKLTVFETESGYFMCQPANATVVAWQGKISAEGTNLPIDEDPDAADWNPVADTWRLANPKQRRDDILAIRLLCKLNPHAFRALKLYEQYVIGGDVEPEIDIRDEESDPTEEQLQIMSDVEKLWCDVLKANRKRFSLSQWAKKVWRDGDAFLWLLPREKWDNQEWPPRIQLLDSLEIDDPNKAVDNGNYTYGIVTSQLDVFDVVSYSRVALRNIGNTQQGEKIADIPADQILHTKIDCEFTDLRGNSRFLSMAKAARQFQSMVDTELAGRKLQASCVLHRKVAGGSNAVRGVVDNSKTSTTSYPNQSMPREKIRQGSIITTNPQVELEFKTPDMNFTDVTPLMRYILLQISVSTGWPEYMITGDASNGNLASSLIQEGPTVKMIEMEQEFFECEFDELLTWIIDQAIANGELDGVGSSREFWDQFDVDWCFPNPVTRDQLKQAQADNIGTMNGSCSPQQAARNQGYKPRKIQREIRSAMEEMPALMMGNAAQNPGAGDKATSSAGNAAAGGTNQGNGGPVSHKDDSGASADKQAVK